MARTIIRRREVMRRTGLSATTLWRLERDGEFPARVRITDYTVGWPEAEVDRWVAERVRAASCRRPPRRESAA